MPALEVKSVGNEQCSPRTVLSDAKGSRRLPSIAARRVRRHVRPSTSAVMERYFRAEATASTTLIAVESGPGYKIRKIYPERCYRGVQLRSFDDRRAQRLRFCGRADAHNIRGAAPAVDGLRLAASRWVTGVYHFDLTQGGANAPMSLGLASIPTYASRPAVPAFDRERQLHSRKPTIRPLNQSSLQCQIQTYPQTHLPISQLGESGGSGMRFRLSRGRSRPSKITVGGWLSAAGNGSLRKQRVLPHWEWLLW